MNRLILFLVLAGAGFGIARCSNSASLGDRALFGFTTEISANSASVSPEASCTTDVTVQSTSVSLVEQGALGGDQTRAWQSTSPFYTDTDTNGGSAYGVYRQEVCFYLVQPFTGTVQIPVSTSQAYASFLSITKSFPVVELGNPLPSTLSFTGNGTTGHGDSARQCFRIEAISDVNTTGETLSITLGEITSGDDNAVYAFRISQT